MTDSDQIPQTPVEPARRSLMQRVSIVWIIPAVALVIALGIAWNTLQNRCALIEISFSNAAGIVAHQTELRFREVSVGVVEKVTFSEDLASVIAHVLVDKDVENYIDADALFWIVQPEVSAQGITGLSTVLSGVYIEGSWDGTPAQLHRHFTGLDHRPVARPDKKGTRIVLSSNTGKGLHEGTPILFKGLEVGRIGQPTLSEDGVTITAEAFVDSPHDALLSSRSRFWNASGFTFNFGTGGASLDVESLASLVTGGVSFETVVSGGSPIDDGAVFSVFANQDDARTSLFEAGGPDGGTVEISMVFEENVSGLTVGAPVTLRGLKIGEVVGLTGRVDEAQYGDERVRLVVVLSIELEQLQLGPDATDAEEILDFFEQAVDEGWRARLASASLLTGGLKIEMVQITDAAPATFVRDAQPYPIFPSVMGETGGVSESAEGLIDKVSQLPIEDLFQSAIHFLDSATALVASDKVQTLPDEINGVVSDLRSFIGSDSMQQLPERVGTVAQELVDVLEDLRDRDGVAKLVDAVEKAGDTAASITTVADKVPALIERIEALSAKAEALNLEALLTQATDLVQSAEGILGSQETQVLPKRIVEAIATVDAAVLEATVLMAELNETDAAIELTKAITAAGDAAKEVSSAVEGVPELIKRIDGVAAKVEALDLQTLLTKATDLIESADGILGTEDAKELPGRVNEALASLESAVDQATSLIGSLNESDAADQLSKALTEAGDAATSISTAVAGVPDLVKRVDAVAAKAEQIDLDTLADEITKLVADVDALIDTDAARALPASLNGALDEVRVVLEELQAGGTVENVNATLASAREAASAVARASDELPKLVSQAETVLREATSALAGFTESGALNRDARASLREISRAAEAVRSLARMLERRPNALITGSR